VVVKLDSRCGRFFRLIPIGLCLVFPLESMSDTTAHTLSIGRDASAEDVARWDIDVGPDGAGLPAGSGTGEQGAAIYADKCASCHGPDGRLGRNKLAGSPGDEHAKTIGSYWPYATTIFDYIRRAMPPSAPGSLTDHEVYALTAHMLYLNSIIADDQVMNAETLPLVAMPARDRFVPDDRRGGAEVR
jgi:cytochrome c